MYEINKVRVCHLNNISNSSRINLNIKYITPYSTQDYLITEDFRFRENRFVLSENKTVTIMVLINSTITLSKEICSGNEFSRVLFPDNYCRDFYRPTITELRILLFNSATPDRFQF